MIFPSLAIVALLSRFRVCVGPPFFLYPMDFVGVFDFTLAPVSLRLDVVYILTHVGGFAFLFLFGALGVAPRNPPIWIRRSKKFRTTAPSRANPNRNETAAEI